MLESAHEYNASFDQKANRSWALFEYPLSEHGLLLTSTPQELIGQRTNATSRAAWNLRPNFVKYWYVPPDKGNCMSGSPKLRVATASGVYTTTRWFPRRKYHNSNRSTISHMFPLRRPSCRRCSRKAGPSLVHNYSMLRRDVSSGSPLYFLTSRTPGIEILLGRKCESLAP